MRSAGLILYRRNAGTIEVLLGHMGGPLWAERDEGAWSIAKGLIEKGEAPLQAAIREFREEFGPLPQPKDPMPLTEIKQKGGKRVIAWAVEGDFDPAQQKSGLFALQWPPRSGRIQQFPEIDRVEWMPIDKACSKAIEGQAELFRELERKLLEG